MVFLADYLIFKKSIDKMKTACYLIRKDYE